MQRRDRNARCCQSEDVPQSSCGASKSAWLAPVSILAPLSPKLGRPRRTAPSYGGRPAYLIGLSALYPSLGRRGLGRHTVVAMTRRGGANGMRLAPAQGVGAAESELVVCAIRRCWPAVRIEIPSRLRRRPTPTVARRALR